jgi:hypothetical protein
MLLERPEAVEVTRNGTRIYKRCAWWAFGTTADAS